MTNWMKFKKQNTSSFNLKKLHGRWTWDKAQRFTIYEVTPEKGTENGGHYDESEYILYLNSEE